MLYARLVLAAVFALVLGACAPAANLATAPVDMAALSKSAFAARSAYAATLIVATQYVRLPRCGQPASPPICSDPPIVATMRKAELAADAATLAGEDAVRTLGATPALAQLAVTGATNSVQAFKAIAETYAPKGVK